MIVDPRCVIQVWTYQCIYVNLFLQVASLCVVACSVCVVYLTDCLLHCMCVTTSICPFCRDEEGRGTKWVFDGVNCMLHPLLSPESKLVLHTVQVYYVLFHFCALYLSFLYSEGRVSIGWHLHVHYGVYNGGNSLFWRLTIFGNFYHPIHVSCMHVSANYMLLNMYTCLHAKMMNAQSAAIAEEGFLLVWCFLEHVWTFGHLNKHTLKRSVWCDNS